MSGNGGNASGGITARYFAIKRFAVHDGPGVRTAGICRNCRVYPLTHTQTPDRGLSGPVRMGTDRYGILRINGG